MRIREWSCVVVCGRGGAQVLDQLIGAPLITQDDRCRAGRMDPSRLQPRTASRIENVNIGKAAERAD